MQVGVISDTHGLLRPQVLEIFRSVDLILHAGDIGTPQILDDLRRVASVRAIRGNNDTAQWASSIPETAIVHVGGVTIYLIHDFNEMKLKPPAKHVDVVISGHSHRPLIDRRGGVLLLNPGSAGPRRFKLPISVARMKINGSVVRPELIELTP
jgi:putative phosphoesterase